jgi:hypothetical protein
MKSTIDWCELNYINSEYVAEYWNTITGVFLIISGVMFYNLNKKLIMTNNIYIRQNFKNIYNLLILVGIGTMLFHGTLLYPFQLLDEIPMILLASQYIQILLNLNIVTIMFNQNIIFYLDNIIFIIPSLCIIISLSYFINISLQIITFHVTLKITEISLVFILYNLSFRLNKFSYDIIYKNHVNNTQLNQSNQISLTESIFCDNNKGTKNSKYSHLINVQKDILEYIKIRKNISTLINSALFYYGISISFWIIENVLCNYIYYLQLHSFWHILSSIGIYKLNQIIVNYTLIDQLLYKNTNKNY